MYTWRRENTAPVVAKTVDNPHMRTYTDTPETGKATGVVKKKENGLVE